MSQTLREKKYRMKSNNDIYNNTNIGVQFFPSASRFEELKPQITSFAFNFLAGGFSGALSETMLAPMERVKLLLQLQNMNGRSNNVDSIHHKPYKSIVDAFRRIPREEGFSSFWRGNWTNVLRYFPTQALNFSLKDLYRSWLGINGSNNNSSSGGLMWKNFVAGGAAGATTLVFVYPLDLTRTRLAADVGRSNAEREFKGLRDCIQKVYGKNGFFGFYKGFPISVTGIIVYRACYFGGYDTCKSILDIQPSTPIWYQWIVAQAVTTSSALFSYPLDTLRRSMMMQSGGSRVLYQDTWECARAIMAGPKGWRGFYRGAFMNTIKGSAGAIVLVLYDALHHYYSEKVL